MAFAGHFHCHDEFSPLDGTGSRNQLSKEAVKYGQTHLGCTNHGRLGSILDHVHACRHPEELDDPDDPGQKRSADERLIPILGIEAFWRPDRFMDLTDQDKYGKNGHNWAQHLCVHARSMTGWHTLMRLSSKSWVKREHGGGHYGKPCFDWDMLENDHEDIVISTACLASPLSQLILQGDERGARKWLERMCKIVGQDNLFLEIMPHDLDQQRLINVEKINLASDFGLPYMVTGDVHMPYKDWVETQSIVRMASYGTTVSKQDKKKDAGEEIYTEAIDTIYLSSEKALKAMFAKHHPDLPTAVVKEGLDNTVEFTRRFRPYVIGKSVKLPKAFDNHHKTERILWDWAQEGLAKYGKAQVKEYIARLEYEYNVIKNTGTLDYFYIVGNMLRWANSEAPLPVIEEDPEPVDKRPINTDVRGSAAGCLFSWAIGITTMDSIAWGLKFERFLNPDRVGLPDIDIDIESDYDDFWIIDKAVDGREMCIEFLRRTYGTDHVAGIIAYQTFAPRAVIRAVANTQDIPYKEIDRATELIGDKDNGLDKIAGDIEEVAKFRDKYPELWVHMTRLENQVLRDSRHAAGIVITPRPITDYMPTQLGADDKSIVTAWADRIEFPIITDYGFVKLDVLGVKGLAKQELARHYIQDHYGEDFDIRRQPEMLDPYDCDQRVLDLFSQGITFGLFQFSGRGITQLLRHIKPDNAMDISVANAMYRPGPMNMAFEYGDRKNGKTPITYWHESLEPILGETLGLMCFQEQAMEVVQQLAGFSAGDADNFRKIMSKLYRLPGDAAQRVMQKDHDRFIDGCMKISGLREETAEDIWTSKMLPLGNYLFNKSHSSDYGLRAITDARIKLHYPLAFYASLLTIEKKQKRDEQIAFLKGVMREASIFDIEVAPPDVNNSGLGWSIDGRRIRYGLASISGLGSASSQEIINHRQFANFKAFIRQMPSGFGADSIVALAKAGAFDEMEERGHLLSSARKWGEHIRKINIKMTCGCKKQRTIKLSDAMMDLIRYEFEDVKPSTSTNDLLDMATELILDEVECKKHADGEVADHEEIDPYYFVAAWYKEHADRLGQSFPVIDIEPSQDELIAYETEALNVPLSLRRMLDQYTPFIQERIYTEEEVDELPTKPMKKGKKHGGTCACAECEAAHCVVGGEVTSVKRIQTKNGEPMAFVDVAFEAYNYNLTIFPWAYRKFGKLLDKPSVFLFAGHKQDRKGQSNILVYDVKDVREIAEAEGWKPTPNLGEIAQRAVKQMKIKTKRKVATVNG